MSWKDIRNPLSLMGEGKDGASRVRLGTKRWHREHLKASERSRKKKNTSGRGPSKGLKHQKRSTGEGGRNSFPPGIRHQYKKIGFPVMAIIRLAKGRRRQKGTRAGFQATGNGLTFEGGQYQKRPTET